MRYKPMVGDAGLLKYFGKPKYFTLWAASPTKTYKFCRTTRVGVARAPTKNEAGSLTYVNLVGDAGLLKYFGEPKYFTLRAASPTKTYKFCRTTRVGVARAPTKNEAGSLTYVNLVGDAGFEPATR